DAARGPRRRVVDRPQPCLVDRCRVGLTRARLVESEFASGHPLQSDGVQLLYQVQVAPGLAEPPIQVARPTPAEPPPGPIEHGPRFLPAGAGALIRRLSQVCLDRLPRAPPPPPPCRGPPAPPPPPPPLPCPPQTPPCPPQPPPPPAGGPPPSPAPPAPPPVVPRWARPAGTAGDRPPTPPPWCTAA